MSETDTRDAILDAAERLFAERGFAATSVREIIREAGVNTAAVHYHFGSRDGLIAALVSRRTEPINRARLERLDALEAAAGDAAPPLEAILEALVAPVVEVPPERGVHPETLPRLIGRLMVEQSEPAARQAMYEAMSPVFDRFLPVLERALPELPRAELLRRLHLGMGALIFSVSVPPLPACRAVEPPPRERVASLVRFIAAGLRAPTPESNPGHPPARHGGRR